MSFFILLPKFRCRKYNSSHKFTPSKQNKKQEKHPFSPSKKLHQILVFNAIATTGLGDNNKIQIFLYNPIFLMANGGANTKSLCRYAVSLPGLC
jgi:hypothetical protein